MIERYIVLDGRIRQELGELQRILARAKRAVAAFQRHSEDRDLYLDSGALNLHDFTPAWNEYFHKLLLLWMEMYLQDMSGTEIYCARRMRHYIR